MTSLAGSCAWVRGAVRGRTSWLLALAVAALVAACPLGAAPIDDARGLVGTTWYTVSILNQRVGYAFREVVVDEGGDNGPVLRVVQKIEARVELKALNAPLTITSEIVATYDANLRPLELSVSNDEFGRRREVHARITDDAIETLTRVGGTETRTSLPLPPNFGSDLPLILAIARGEAKVGDKVEFDTFDPDLAKCDHHEMVITDQVELPDGRTAYVVKSKSARLPVEVVSHIARDGTLVSFATPGLLNLSVEQASEEEALAAAAPLVLSSEIPANKNISEPRRLQTLKVRITAGQAPTANLAPATARQSVRHEGDGIVVTIKRLPFEGASASLPLPKEQFGEYLTASETAQIDDPAIRAKAREIIGDEKDARRAASMIVRWVYENMRKVRSEPRLVSAREVLEQMSGDCTEHAVLCGALAAAAGIPAKLVTGIAYAHGAFYYHAWNELYVGEWVEMDAAWGEVSVDAGHIRLAAGSLDLESLAKMALAAGRSLGSLDVEILEYHLEDAGL